MGCHYHVFVGPYLEVHNPIKWTTENIMACPSAECSKHAKRSSDSFCPNCGCKIQMVEVAINRKKNFSLYEKFPKERLIEIRFEGMPEEYKDFMLFKSNIYDSPGKTLCDETVVLPMDQNTANTEIGQFAKDFATELSYIESVFGTASVRIKWGIIGYWY
jgi:hypothetical protein